MDDRRGGQLPGSLELAFLGDSIYDLFVRDHLVRRGGRIKLLHTQAVAQVRASAQSAALIRIEPMLSQPELAVVRRARNAKQTPPKGAERADYCRATALEALIGYLYYTGQRARMEEILSAAIADAPQPTGG